MRMTTSWQDAEGNILGLCDDGQVYMLYQGARVHIEHYPGWLPEAVRAKYAGQYVQVHGWVPLPNQHHAVVTLFGTTETRGSYSSTRTEWVEATPDAKEQFLADVINANNNQPI